MKIFYMGDFHGRTNDLGRITMKAEAVKADYIVQVGDMGLFWPTTNEIRQFKRDGVIRSWSNSNLDNWIKKRVRKGWTVPIITVLGNHDNWSTYYQLQKEQDYPDLIEVYPNSGFYIAARGSVINLCGIDHLFLGGAESTDKYRRTPGVTWWSEEEPSAQEFETFHQNLEKFKPDTVVAHEAPLRVELFRVRRDSSYTPNMLERCLQLSDHSPRHYFFGHHHLLETWRVKKIKFYCSGLHGQGWVRHIRGDGTSLIQELD